jgi:hypothetical protein
VSDPNPEGCRTKDPLTGEPDRQCAPMRLRAEPPRVTRLSRKVLAGSASSPASASAAR